MTRIHFQSYRVTALRSAALNDRVIAHLQVRALPRSVLATDSVIAAKAPQRWHHRVGTPDLTQRRRPFQQGVQCEACKRLGHEAANCDMLALGLFITRYMKEELSAANRDAIEQQWLKRWKNKLGMPARTPRQVMSYENIL
jgi:hypothetical protein